MWETIKKILQKQGGTCIIIEEGKPTYVVTNFEEFQRLLETKEGLSTQKAIKPLSEQELLEKINQEITNWKVTQTEDQATEQVLEEETKVEDLPV